jgi:hypothetical protein
MPMNATNVHLLGQIAVKEGFVTPAQLDECVTLQAGGEKKSLGALLVEKGYLTPAKLSEITRLQQSRFEALAADPKKGGLFGQIAVRHGYLTPPKLAEGLREQEALSQTGSSLALGQILLKKGHLSVEQFLEILRLQKKEIVRCPACDTFYDVRESGGQDKFLCSRCATVVRVPK